MYSLYAINDGLDNILSFGVFLAHRPAKPLEDSLYAIDDGLDHVLDCRGDGGDVKMIIITSTSHPTINP